MVSNWKRALQKAAAEIFENGHNSRHDLKAQMDELNLQIGRRQVERDFLAKKPDEVYYGLPSPIKKAA